ncbi:hypothetical protein FALCPG4_018443 [Fusarium falciforme]
MSLSGKVYGVTGGASGIGLATAKLISERGGTVCIADVNTTALKEVEAYLKTKDPKVQFSVTQADVSNKNQVESWITGIKSQFGRLDGAANIAGIIGKSHGIQPLSELEDDEWFKILNINLTGMMYCLRAELNHIENGGSIVNMASIHATTGKLSCPQSSRMPIMNLLTDEPDHR